jgi:S-formylglutathione hydrolase FrmB
LGLKHPELFCSIGSHSGALTYAKTAGERIRAGQQPPPRKEPSTKPVPEIGIEGFSSQAERTPKGKIFDKPEDCDACDPFKLVLQIPRERLPHLYLDCGTEDRLIDGAQAFAKLLMEKKIPFAYAQSSGGHSGPYWTREVGLSMAVQYAILQRHLRGIARMPASAAAKQQR